MLYCTIEQFKAAIDAYHKGSMTHDNKNDVAVAAIVAAQGLKRGEAPGKGWQAN